jgi:hypothetical protein
LFVCGSKATLDISDSLAGRASAAKPGKDRHGWVLMLVDENGATKV